ncbi:MAG: ribonuclease PH [Bdellovibrionales bacterium]
MRANNRRWNELRPTEIQAEVIRYAEGSVQISMGHTKVICTASAEPGVPKWLAGTGRGWISAEYGMLPRSTHTRISREKAMTGGRSQEISRLLGRSLRAAVDLEALGERQILLDCDVIQADGGTRTAAITGGFVALALCLQFLRNQGELKTLPLKCYVAATSVGLIKGQAHLDLDYDEDSSCETDMNFVMTSKGEFVEVQGTAESGTFTKKQMDDMAELAGTGCNTLFSRQAEILKDIFPLT